MKSWIKLRVEGLNLDRQLNLMIKKGVTVKNISRPRKKILEFSVPHSQKSNALAFFSAECYNIIIVDTEGFAAVRQFARQRAALLVCFLVFTICLFFLNGYIWRVEIQADGNRETVAQALRENGIWLGADKNGIELDAAENAICNKLPEVKYAVVSIKGCTLFVKTYNKETPSDIVDLNKPNNIYAQSDGVVSRILVVSGTSRVNVGDEIKKGQLLIEGVRTFPDESTEPVCAVGEVFATVSKRGESQFEQFKTTLKKTEESKKFFSLRLFGFTVFEKFADAYDRRITESTSAKFFPLPIEITTTVVYRAEEVRQEQNFEDCRETCRQEALSGALASLGATVYKDIVYGEIKNDVGILVTAEVFAEVRVDSYVM